MRVGIEFVPDIKYYELEYYAKLAEDNGFSDVWITDHYNNRNAYSILTLLAVKTDRMRLGVGVTNPYHINPALTASAIATINEISGGRAVLGIGPGDKATLERIGISWERPLTAVREAVEVIRKLHAGKRVSYKGRMFELREAKLSFKTGPIPIYIGAQGPRMLSLAGEIGDGVLINASHPKDFEEAMKNVEKGLSRSGRSREDVDIVAYTSMSIDKDRKKARDAAKIVVAFIVYGSPQAVLDRHGLRAEDVDRVREALTKGDWPGVIKAVTDEMINAFSISGTPDDAVERIAELSKVGVTTVVAGSPIGPRKDKSIELIGKEVIPKFE